MPRFQPRSRFQSLPLAAALLAATLLAAGCSSKVLDPTPPTIEPTTAAVSPPVATAPAGVVLSAPVPGQAAIIDPHSRALVVLGAEPDTAATLTVLDAGADRVRTLELPAPATALTSGADGTVYLSVRGGYLVVDLAERGAVTRVQVRDHTDTDFTAIARRADGRVVLGSADGSVFILRPDADDSDADADPDAATVEHRISDFARVDALVTQGDTTVVLDRGQTSVTNIDADGTVQQSLRAGEGSTTMAADPAGRIVVADTRGAGLLVFSADPLIMRQRYPVPSAPYGLAGSTALTWVSQTAANTVVGYDLATGIPVEKVRYPTVQQPNALSFDADSDTLYVVSGSGAGIQVIEHASEPR